MRFKRLLALLLAAALALSLLAGCGGGESVASALLKLLDGKYPNISIEIDPDLEADLRQAIRTAEAESENETDDEAAIRAALETLLGSNITFRYLGEGQKGDTAFDLVFYAGTDPDKAAQAAYSQWNIVFANVPDDGKYGTGLAMVETENGIWMLVKATVEKAGTVDKPDTDDDEPEQQEPPEQEKGYTEVTDSNGNVTGYTVNTKDGLQELFVDKGTAAASATITLTTDQTITDTALLTDTFSGTLNGNGNTITMEGTREQGLFNTIDTNGKVLNVDIKVGTIQSSIDDRKIGAVAGENYGTIENCNATGGTIQCTSGGNRVGGIAGINYNKVTGCTVTSIQINAFCNHMHVVFAGGIVAWNYGSIESCHVTGDTQIKAHGVTDLDGIFRAGGMVGCNEATGTIGSNCTIGANTTISGGGVHNFNTVSVGGVVGYNASDADSIPDLWKGNGNYENITAWSESESNFIHPGENGTAEKDGCLYVSTRIGYDEETKGPVN